MRCKPPDKRFYEELKDLNAGFLALIADHRLEWHGPLLGLDAGVVAGIRSLSQSELDFIAATPGSLAGFPTLPPPHIVAESQAHTRPVNDRWLEAARLYSTELVMYLWQIARRDQLVATLCVGTVAGRAGQLADMSLREIQGCAAAVYQLEARLGRHRRFWPDLIRAARSADRDFRFWSRMTIIPLTLAEGRAAESY
jgi:hypothetical protein